ncbi:right-handed parallel beta-helix repeat-containing protein [Reichenbachiella carrageenanivorans]|uniref:Right-handed parallel beta-helix repeat-containing protein n=1 Tax=Reichenbachiella carrageenanivorans TaxID=2979869 RepID=A0ABY6D4T5_9BACT|nr:right-handed parallel beta-helix repeat-containing protein [Reichenbachiella carrageenanivorans]UXX80068.1 right-handed parallel beta-helix repeat-containing protein [Reichenbachiella carrageenanivorans]
MNMRRWIVVFLIGWGGLGYAQQNFVQPDFFRTKRQAPLLDLPIKTQISVADFGAIPDDGKDDIGAIDRAISKAIAKASEDRPVELIFEKGIYDLFARDEVSHAFEIREMKYVVVNGNGAELVIHNPQSGFVKLLNCKNIIFKDMVVDYDPLPFTQGIVVALDTINYTFDLKIDEGFPLLSDKQFEISPEVWGVVLDKNTPGKLKDGVPSLFPDRGWKEVSPGVFRVQHPAKRYTLDMDIGDPYVQIARRNGRTIFTSYSGENVTYLNITSYTSPSGSYSAFNHKEWNVIGCKILMREGRQHSANADCIHVSGSYIGPWVENVLFEGYTDDAFNLKSQHRTILKVISPTDIVVKYDLKTGDILRFFNPRKGILIGEAMVMQASHLGQNEYQVSLSQPIEGLDRVGEGKRNDGAYVDTRACESFVIRNSTFRNARRYGLNLQNGYGVIENNIFENLSQSAINFGNGVDWGEGLAAHHILIQNNIFKNCGYDDTYLKEYNGAAVRMKMNKLKNPESKSRWCGVATADWQGINNIWILNNTFMYNKMAMSIECSENIFLQGNRYIHNHADPYRGEELDKLFLDNNSGLINKD